MVKGIGGLGFLDSFHCEKTSFITAGAFVGLLYFAYLAIFQNTILTVQFPFIEDPFPCDLSNEIPPVWTFIFCISIFFN